MILYGSETSQILTHAHILARALDVLLWNMNKDTRVARKPFTQKQEAASQFMSAPYVETEVLESLIFYLSNTRGRKHGVPPDPIATSIEDA